MLNERYMFVKTVLPLNDEFCGIPELQGKTFNGKMRPAFGPSWLNS